ncbi:MAG: DegT/DnrJ/EryC1/StrS family aminotransferase [Solirubrobacterales bacterium]
MRVPFLDLGAAYDELAPELDAAYREVMESGRLLFGEQLACFEAEYASYCGAHHCAGVGSGFDALVLALRALGVERDDEVLVPSHTAVMTWLAVAAIGADPVGVEPCEATYTIDPDRLDAARTDRTRAVIPVHLYGRPAEMGPILSWAREREVPVLSDAAQAHGARIGGRPLGGLGDAVAWSFYPSKNLGAFADGGCVTSDDPDLIDRVRRLRNYGFADGGAAAGVATEVGVNSRLDELQAAFLRVRLRHLDEWNDRRRDTARFYLETLADLPLGLPPADDRCESAWHQFVIRLSDREVVQMGLSRQGVETLVHYPLPPFAHPALRGAADPPPSFPIADCIANEVLSLPMGPQLGEGRERVADALREVLTTSQTG